MPDNAALPMTELLIAPFDLQRIESKDPLVFKKHLIAAFDSSQGQGTLPGDSGSPLLVKLPGGKDNEWYVAGIMSHSNFFDKTEELTVVQSYYTRLSTIIDWVEFTIAREESSLENTYITVHEIAHVVALTRLKHLKELTGASGFNRHFGISKEKRWVNLAEHMAVPGAYSALSNVKFVGLPFWKKETQLAVLWALVSSPENYKVLQEMLTDQLGLESRIPYFMRLGWEDKGDVVQSFDGLQSFKVTDVGGSGEWSDGCPQQWTAAKTEINGKEPVKLAGVLGTSWWYEREVGEAVQENAERANRSNITAELSKKRKIGKVRFLEARPLRRRMYCQFIDELRQYMLSRRPWYPKYFQWNNITSPGRTRGMYECVIKGGPLAGLGDAELNQYFYTPKEPRTSYGNRRSQCAGYRVVPYFDMSSFPNLDIFPPEWRGDSKRAWLQDDGEYWPELTATTLYDRYEWIELPDDKRKITFREALFLVVHEEHIDISTRAAGLQNVERVKPYIVDPYHKSQYELERFNPSFLLYFHHICKTDLVTEFMMREKLRASLVVLSETEKNVYNINDPVFYFDEDGKRRQCTIIAGISWKPKNKRIIRLSKYDPWRKAVKGKPKYLRPEEIMLGNYTNPA